MKLYGSDVYEEFMEDPKCAGCGDLATQRCSKCKEEWYCSRECQLKQWKQHKQMCQVTAELKANDSVNQQKIKETQQRKEQEKVEKKKPMIEELN